MSEFLGAAKMLIDTTRVGVGLNFFGGYTQGSVVAPQPWASLRNLVEVGAQGDQVREKSLGTPSTSSASIEETPSWCSAFPGLQSQRLGNTSA